MKILKLAILSILLISNLAFADNTDMKKLLIFLIILISITSNVAWSSPGFKDLKVGNPIFQVMKFCN